jgi:2-iminobutanoate/2-iminopropanoate deaminase
VSGGRAAVASARAPGAIGPYSQGIATERLVFVSGQLPAGADGVLCEGGIGEQTERCLKNIAEILGAAGLSLNDVVKTTVFLTDLAKFQEMNEVYARHFRAPYPARSTIGVSALPRGVPIEIEAVAVRP